MTLSYTTTERDSRLDVLSAAIGSAGILKIYGGSVPATVGASLGGATLLAQLTCGTPFAPASSAGLLTANAIATESSADGTGTAAFFRITDSLGNAQIQGSCGTSGADLNFNSTSIAAGAQVSVTSLTITEGNP